MLEHELRRHFGFTGFNTGQKAVIELIVRGRSAAAIFPTGAGKSLGCQLPAPPLGVHAAAYHAGLKNEERERIQNEFMQGTPACVVATIAFGMGIDKADIRRVIHFDLPKSIAMVEN
jgi:superfamily II DNA helicase RecQ